MWRNHYLRVGPLFIGVARNPRGWPYALAVKWADRTIVRIGF